MSKGFLIALSVIVLAIAGFWGLGSLYKPTMTASDSAKSELNLTDDERQRITLALASNYNYTGNEGKIDDALQKLENTSEPTTAQMNQFIVDEYQKSQFELEKLARNGDYQAQRNLAFGHATDPEVAGADPAQGCAWYLLLYNSESPQVVDDLDRENIDSYCSAKVLSKEQQRAAEIKANLLLKAIYNKDINVKINDYLSNYL